MRNNTINWKVTQNTTIRRNFLYLVNKSTIVLFYETLFSNVAIRKFSHTNTENSYFQYCLCQVLKCDPLFYENRYIKYTKYVWYKGERKKYVADMSFFHHTHDFHAINYYSRLSPPPPRNSYEHTRLFGQPVLSLGSAVSSQTTVNLAFANIRVWKFCLEKQVARGLQGSGTV
jgi:hypothetical protein